MLLLGGCSSTISYGMVEDSLGTMVDSDKFGDELLDSGKFGDELFGTELGGDGDCWCIVSTLNCSLSLMVRCLCCCGFGVEARTGCGVGIQVSSGMVNDGVGGGMTVVSFGMNGFN